MIISKRHNVATKNKVIELDNQSRRDMPITIKDALGKKTVICFSISYSLPEKVLDMSKAKKKIQFLLSAL